MSKENRPAPWIGARYPHVARWVRDGWIEVGHDDFDRSFVRALDVGGTVWEGEWSYPTLEDALIALDAGIGDYTSEIGIA